MENNPKNACFSNIINEHEKEQDRMETDKIHHQNPPFFRDN